MVWGELLFLFFYGLVEGSMSALCAYGVSLIFGTMSIINLSAGELMMIGSYISYWLLILYDIDPLLSLFFIIGIFTLIGSSMYFLFKPTIASQMRTLLLSYGISVFIMSAALTIWKPDIRIILTSYSFLSFKFLEYEYNILRLISLIFSTFIIFVLYIYLFKTKQGKAIRAIIQDREGSALMGVNVTQIECTSFILATILMGVGGVFFALTHYLHPSIGPPLTIKAFCITVLAGMGNVVGVLYYSLALGIIEVLWARYLKVAYSEAIYFFIFLITLVIRGIKSRKVV